MLLFGSKDSLALASWCARTEDGVVKIVEFRETIATLPGSWDLAHAIRLGIKPFAELGANFGPGPSTAVERVTCD